jgi:hypothetical protein
MDITTAQASYNNKILHTTKEAHISGPNNLKHAIMEGDCRLQSTYNELVSCRPRIDKDVIRE